MELGGAQEREVVAAVVDGGGDDDDSHPQPQRAEVRAQEHRTA